MLICRAKLLYTVVILNERFEIMAECILHKNDKDNCIDCTLGNPAPSIDAMHTSSRKEGMDCATSYNSSYKLHNPSTDLMEPTSAHLIEGHKGRCFCADIENDTFPINDSYGDPTGNYSTPEQETQEGGRPCLLVIGNELSLFHTGNMVNGLQYRIKLGTNSMGHPHSAPPAN